MSAKSSKFLIGLFVISGLLIGAVVIIWISASDLLMKGSTYVAYFDESVQGLQTDSAVKYRGVEIGKVDSIKVAPDYRLIEVVMKINLAGDLRKHIFAQLRTAGITGIVFVELDRIKTGDVLDFQTVNFKTSYPIIPSRRSEISRFWAETNKIMQQIREIDFKGISDQLKSTTKSIETFLAGGRTDQIMRNLESMSANLDKSAAQLNKTIAEGKVDNIFEETSETLADARQLINRARQEVEALNLAQKTDKTGEILDTLDKRTKSITLELQDTAENLRATSVHLQKLSESLNNNPAELIFSKPAPPRKPME
ncbi:MAG: MCE family protein [Syntrophaceae bacterium]|nr:MCE family protein [Syntrophaceae bacterium]